MPTTHDTSATTSRHDGDRERAVSVRSEDFGWTFVEIAFIFVIMLALAGVAVWAVITLRDGSAAADSIDRLAAASVMAGASA